MSLVVRRLLDFLAGDGVGLAVTKDVQLPVTDNLCTLYIVVLYLLDGLGSRDGVVPRSHGAFAFAFHDSDRLDGRFFVDDDRGIIQDTRVGVGRIAAVERVVNGRTLGLAAQGDLRTFARFFGLIET